MPQPPTPEQRRAAHLAAQRIEALLVEMLAAGEMGEAAVIILSPYELKPVKRTETEGRTVKIRQGHGTLETVN